MTFPASSFGPDAAAAKAGSAGRAARALAGLLPQLPQGRLRLTLPNGEAVVSGGIAPGPSASLRLRRWRGLARIALEGEEGFSNGYIDGDWTTPDLVELLALGKDNETAVAPAAKRWLLSFMHNRLAHALRANTRRGSRRNIAAHYDLGNDFFRLWLDAGMNYSAALFSGEDSLEDAQTRKIDRIADLLAVEEGDRVLEIGCGWGAFAERLIRRHGALVCGITLSVEQLAYAKARLADTARADLRLADYRDIAGSFNRVASIEMIEAVGERYWPLYFDTLRARLAKGGIAVIQAITVAEDRFAAYRKRPDFIQRRIFPGGMLPTRAIIAGEAARAGLKLVHHEAFGSSYARTLQEWRRRFAAAAPQLNGLGFDRRFRRMWQYYLSYCEVGFRSGAVNVGLYKFEG
ncbi:MAG TPA: cyclopropane-fatty-acyl-phospholipid synthase family protein [Xanthobacteraceae bacterium]|nr:cyclopropane-fatty-acyl-phospholipid synthase family protein [Xanthobacteraceae bacterium]